MAVLITGGAGFVGANIVKVVAESGREVVCFDPALGSEDRLWAWYAGKVNGQIHEFQGDVTQQDDLREAIEQFDVDGVIHAATITPTPEEERNQMQTILNVNLLGTANVLEVARDHDVDRVVYISSGAVYRNNSELETIDEYDSLDLNGLYPISKHGSEQLAQFYQDRFGLKTVTARLGWIYGHMERPMSSRQHMSSVYNAMRAAIEGNAIRINDVERRRDWTHSLDVARGLQTLLETDSLGEPVYNLTAGRGHSMREVVERIAGLEGGVEVRQVDSQSEANVPVNSSSRRGNLGIARLARETGFTPKFSLKEGLAEYWDWFKKARNAGCI